MAWIKFRFFEPISHPDCVVITPSSTTPLVAWCANRALKNINHKESLSTEQLQALQEASEITNDGYSANEYQCINHLAQRLVWGSPFRSSITSPPPPPAAGGNISGLPPVLGLFANPGPLPAAPPGAMFLANSFSFVGRRSARIHDRWEILGKIRERVTAREATELVSKDDELRTLAALCMPEEIKTLDIKNSCELRIHFALQKSAMKITALTRSLEDTQKLIAKGNGKA
jgi:hypothetical protein